MQIEGISVHNAQHSDFEIACGYDIYSIKIILSHIKINKKLNDPI